jgi:eukaryotic-like serine/threonine-protein kinase
MPAHKIGKFTVLGTLGQGAHSAILHIRCANDNKEYALKVVPINPDRDQKYLEQAHHEYKVAKMLEHPNLIKIYALETPRDWIFRVRKVHLLIEYVNGKTVDTITGLTVPRLAQIFARVADALVHMHRRGVFHADLKPSNIMLSRRGEVKIIDYGLAWIKGEKKGRVQGTPEYMAPEQARQGIVNENTDMYNFGATMYRLATFRLPPSSLTSSEGVPMDAKLFRAELKPVTECNPQVPLELADLIHRCMAFRPADRPARITQVRDVLNELEQTLVKGDEDTLAALQW